MPEYALRKLVFAIAITGTLVGTTIPAPMALSAERPLKPEIISDVSNGIAVIAVFSNDGRYLIKGGERGGASLWEVATGHLVRSFVSKSSDDREYVQGAGYSAALDTVIASNRYGVMSIWKASTGQLLRTINGKLAYQPDYFVFTPDGKRMLHAPRHGNLIEVWNTARWQVERTVKFFAGDIALSNDGRFAIVHSDASSALIDLSQGRELWHRDSSSLGAIAFSPDGSRFAAAGAGANVGTITIFDVQTGSQLSSFSLKETLSKIEDLAFSRDGAQIVAASSDGSIGALDGRTGQVVRKTTVGVACDKLPCDLALAPSGDWLITRPARLWNTQTGDDGPDLGMGLGETGFIRFPVEPGTQSGSTNTILTGNFPGGSGVIHRWDLATGRLLANQKLVNFNWDGDNGVSVALSSDGRLLATGNAFAEDQKPEDSTVALWDESTGAKIAALGEKTPGRTGVAISPDGKLLLSLEVTEAGISGIATLWNIAQRKQLWSTTIKGGGRAVAFSRDGSYVLVGGLVAKLLDATNGKLLVDFKKNESYGITSFDFSSDGSRALLSNGDWQANAEIWDTKTGRLLHVLNGHSKYVSSVSYSPDGTRVLTGGSDGTARIWDAATGRQLLLLRLDSGNAVTYVTFTRNGARVVTGHSDGSVAIWNAVSGELIVTLIATDDGEWVTITPEGFFDASANGGKLLHVVNGVETVSIDQVFQTLFRPDLVREKLAGDPRGLVRAAATNLDLNKVIASGVAPDVRVTLPGRGLSGTVDGTTVSTEAEITDRGGGIGRVEWRINGVTSGVDNPAASAAGQPLRLTRSLALDPGSNEISVMAYNGANLIASVSARLAVTAPQPGAVPLGPAPSAPTPGATPPPASISPVKPRLFMVVAGVNAYADRRITLSYAVSDATEVARAFNKAGAGLYQSVDVKLLTDADVTRDKLDAAFKEVAAKAQASDVFVLYLAGHGKTVDGRYYFIPQNFTVDGELTARFVDPAVRGAGISQDQLQLWFASVPPRRSVILLDTCESGTLTGDAGETQQLERGGANDRLAQATGRSIITAAGGSEEAMEGFHSHGLFTYELLDGLDRADSDGDGSIEVTELAAYLYAEVTELSQKIFKQRQSPQMKITANYPLVKQTRILQDDVTPIAAAKPAFQLHQTAQLQVQPGFGATVVRSLSARTPVTVLESSNGWALLASNGRPIGYVATQDLQPDPKNAETSYARADTGDADRTIASTYFSRGRFYLYTGELPKALADLGVASDADPKSTYIALLLDIANKRSNLPSQLAHDAAAQLDMTRWPAPVVRYYLGEITAEQLLAAADNPNADVRKRQVCDANFYSGELDLQQGRRADATQHLQFAVASCSKGFAEYEGAIAELKTLGASPGAEIAKPDAVKPTSNGQIPGVEPKSIKTMTIHSDQ